MMIYKTRVKPFDVLIKNRMTIMTSGGTVTQLVDECQVKRREGWPTTDKNPSTEGKLSYQKTVHQNNFKTGIILLWLLKRFCEFHDLKASFYSLCYG